ncbi:uncharacterized protein LOC134234100 [Saccostrea cucullata]|uniref:uncharacterized protein LOC134234100 n=1 Tax=Saccostrea cuccullata TaxID=36930 RepID=UPI002ED34B31
MAASKPKYSLGSPQEHIEMCETHDLPIDVICEDCDEFICGKCAKTDHRDHEWSTISTAASQRRRGLLKLLTKIKEENLPEIEEEMEKVSNKMTENKELCDAEITKLQKHVDEIMARLTEIWENKERRLSEDLKEQNKKLNYVKSELNKKKKEIEEMVKFMEENNSTMSDYSFIDNHRELSKKLTGQDVHFSNFNYSLRYVTGETSDDEMENMIGKVQDSNISLIETNSFKYGDEGIAVLRALCEDQCYIGEKESPYIEQVNKDGEKKYKCNVTPNDLCVTDTGDVFFTDGGNNAISCLSSSGSVSTVISTDPVEPLGICQSVDGGLLVTLRDRESDRYKVESNSRRLVRHITVTGDVINEYEYQEDGQTRLFTDPYRVTQNSDRDICVVNHTSSAVGELVIMSPSGRMKSIYQGQKLTETFKPGDVVCNSLCNILVIDVYNNQIHLLSPDGEFLKFLLPSDNDVSRPVRLSFYKSTLWVGYLEGFVKVFQYTV